VFFVSVPTGAAARLATILALAAAGPAQANSGTGQCINRARRGSCTSAASKPILPMPTVDRTVLVPWTAELMFDLVADVHGYPRFLPWCSGADTREIAPETHEATIELDYRGIRTRFSTRNRLQRPESLKMELLNGPFQELNGTWQFVQIGDAGSRVRLELAYRMAAGPLGRALAPVFDALAGTMIDAFVREAERRDGLR